MIPALFRVLRGGSWYNGDKSRAVAGPRAEGNRLKGFRTTLAGRTPRV